MTKYTGLRLIALLGGTDLDQFPFGRWLRDLFSIFSHAFQVEVDGVSNKFHNLFASIRDSYAPRKIRDVSTPTRFALFDNHQKFHQSIP